MVSRKLSFLEQNLIERARERAPLSPLELLKVAALLRSLQPQIEAMEARPVPPAFRVMQGGLA